MKAIRELRHDPRQYGGRRGRDSRGAGQCGDCGQNTREHGVRIVALALPCGTLHQRCPLHTQTARDFVKQARFPQARRGDQDAHIFVGVLRARPGRDELGKEIGAPLKLGVHRNLY